MKLLPIALSLTFAAGLLTPCFALDGEWQALNDGGEAQFKLKNYTGAEALFIKARKLATDRSENQELAKTLFDMAWMYDSLGRLNDSETLYSQLVQARTAAYGPNSIEVAKALKLLADEQSKQGKYDKAEGNLVPAVKILDAINPATEETNKVLIGLLKDLAGVCRHENKDADATAYDNRANQLGLSYVQNNFPH